MRVGVRDTRQEGTRHARVRAGARLRSLRAGVRDLAGALRPHDVGRRHPRPLPSGPAPPSRPRRHAEFRLPQGRLGASDAHRPLRRHHHLRHHRGRREGGARVRKIHAMLGATDPDTGERYGVDEPPLLLWVHCAEIDSYLHVIRRSGIRCRTRSPTGTSTNTAAAPGWSASTPVRSPARRLNSPRTSRGSVPNSPPGPTPAPSTTSSAGRPHTRCSPRRARCCGGAWPIWRTPPCRRTPTGCTAEPPHRPPR